MSQSESTLIVKCTEELPIEYNYITAIDSLSYFKFPNGSILSKENFKPVHFVRYITKHPNSIPIIISDLRKMGLQISELLRKIKLDSSQKPSFIIEIQIELYILFCKTMECLFIFKNCSRLKHAIIEKQRKYKIEVESANCPEYTDELKKKLFDEFDRFEQVLNSYDLV